jgi:hypothetical protein
MTGTGRETLAGAVLAGVCACAWLAAASSAQAIRITDRFINIAPFSGCNHFCADHRQGSSTLRMGD